MCYEIPHGGKLGKSLCLVHGNDYPALNRVSGPLASLDNGVGLGLDCRLGDLQLPVTMFRLNRPWGYCKFLYNGLVRLAFIDKPEAVTACLLGVVHRQIGPR